MDQRKKANKGVPKKKPKRKSKEEMLRNNRTNLKRKNEDEDLCKIKKPKTQGNNDEVRKKVFNDPVHGHIKLHWLCVKIINLPEFQRLRFIKQLGGAYFVYPGAAHNRFEHSIGVCHLAGKFLKSLKTRLAVDNIDEKDILCVEIAGLCHDLGHGPYSHLFDELVIPIVTEKTDKKWKHEDGSVNMFSRIFNQLKTEFSNANLDETDAEFIKTLIKVPDDYRNPKNKKLEERIQNKHFLYQIVSNKESGVDVDKWDYFARDCLMTGNKSNFDHTRTIEFSMVLPDEHGDTHICFRDKEADCLFDMFNARYLLHKRVCYHRVTTAVQIMIADALIETVRSQSDEVKFKGEGGKLRNLKEATLDMTAYLQITDEVILQIYRSEDKKLKAARDIVDRVFRRNFYHFIGIKPFKEQFYRVHGNDERTIHDMAKEDIMNGECDDKTKDSIAVYVAKFDYGKGGQNPLDNVYFFTKEDSETAKKLTNVDIHVSSLRPSQFSEQQVLVYCRSDEEEIRKKVKEIFEKWNKKPR